MARYVAPLWRPLHVLTFVSPDLFYDKRYSHTQMVNPDFVKLAGAMGVHAIRCETSADLPAKMKEFLEYDNSKPILLECVVEKNEHVFPMVRLMSSFLGSGNGTDDPSGRYRQARPFTRESSTLP